MRQTFKISTQLALTTVLSLALCTAVSLAGAQAKMSKDKTSKDKMKTSKTMDDHSRMSGMSDDDSDDGMPVNPMYPTAAPGSIDLNHWTDYTRKHMRTGSATEAKMDKQSKKMDAHGRMDRMEDEDELIPAAPSYPRVSPGGIDMYHWSDYTRKHLRQGSATDAKMDKMDKKDRAMRSNTMTEEDEENLLPLTPSYPWAAPGTLDMNHWTDMRQKHMMAGSAADMKDENTKKRDQKKRMK